MTDQVTLLGIRHHGPGSARAVAAALEQLRPDAVLIEGPPEADQLLALAGDKEMTPPVALLAHVVDDPAKAAFWPFAAFSPEWVALRYAVESDVPVRFIDLPAAAGFALAARSSSGVPGGTSGEPGGGSPAAAGHQSGSDADSPTGPTGPADAHGAARGDGTAGAVGATKDGDPAETGQTDQSGLSGPSGSSGPSVEVDDSPAVDAIDPIAELARAAGHDDPERWWEDVVEHRTPDADALAPFAAVAEAMTALREDVPVGRRDELREAHMRQQIRAARRAGHARIAVVCGAWHVPALQSMPTVAHDRALLAGLPRKPKTEITWVPWTHRRLSQHTGYGAGIDSPGWYHHLFTTEQDTVAHWMTRVAELLRAEDHPVSSAHVIEAVRLAETLAAMRGRPLAGLTETLDAVRAVMCDGSDIALALVHDRLVIGDALGEVPDGAPAVPLQRDLARLHRSLRLKPDAGERELALDLRKELDADRSRLLHRLRLLGIDWGVPSRSAVNSTGTFRETWSLRWEPEFAVRIVEAAQWGTTVESAATGKAVEEAAGAQELAELTALAERCLLAGLPGALPAVMRLLADRAALDTDVAHLAAALPALVRSLRYGDVRATDGSALAEVAHGLAERICVGLPPACTGLDADGATAMRAHLDAVHTAMALLPDAPEPTAPESETGGAEPANPAPAPVDGVAERWAAALHSLAAREPAGGPATGVPGVLRGRAVRLLLDEGRLAPDEAGRRMRLVLSPAGAPADAAGWIEGFLSGGGALLLHDPALLGLLDDWLSGVPADTFTDLLPVLRRTFSALEAGVRRTIGERVAAGPLTAAPVPAAARPSDLDPARADAALATLALLLGLPAPDDRPGLARIPRQADRRAS
ncbi:DUF5682 family protein [Kitasatospora paracochleata]|uniref:Uncharacterized protein n=1 Tax=Kitasatospora paracochleata TaxID=58354 RepID=A0ABT1IXL3_9ACTN|nr:DUF5682 family protein [Kitasatospora paracochleata]MCP2309890.1 hypothetical protein [Kitasatospora paracochleata]